MPLRKDDGLPAMLLRHVSALSRSLATLAHLTRRVALARYVLLFADLLARDANWRNKLLKIVQYGSRLAVLHYRSAVEQAAMLSAAMQLAVVRTRVASGAAASAAAAAVRHPLQHGAVPTAAALDALRTEVRELVAMSAALWAGGRLVLTREFALKMAATATSTLSGVADDINTCAKVGLIDAKRLPPWYARFVNSAWAARSLWALYFSAAKFGQAAAAAADRREAAGQAMAAAAAAGVALVYTKAARKASTGAGAGAATAAMPPTAGEDYPDAPLGSGAATIAAASAAATAGAPLDMLRLQLQVVDAYREAMLAALVLANRACDVGQSLPLAIPELVAPPDSWEVWCGLGSAVFSTAKIWLAAEWTRQKKERAPAPAAQPLSASAAAGVPVPSTGAGSMTTAPEHALAPRPGGDATWPQAGAGASALANGHGGSAAHNGR
jgi:hypothetical protein